MIEIADYKIAFDRLWAEHQAAQADNARLREALEAIIAMDDHDEQADRVADAIEEIKRDWLQ